MLDGLLAQQSLDDAQRDLAQRLGSVDPVRELEQAARLGIRFVVPGDPEWPARLDDLAAHEAHQSGLGGVPVGLWLRGPLRLDELPPMVAVVGSRSSTTYGERVAADVSAAAARAGMVVVSGAAAGIDQAAHRGALAAGGTTRGRAGLRPERAYPTANRPLIDHIAATGLVVSEVPPGSAPLRSRFLGRNRLIAALSVGTVVVEAARRSGALSSARWASALNRVVMGVPGPVTSITSQGVHDEIRKGAMHLVTTGADVLELVGAAGEHLVEVRRERPRARATAWTGATSGCSTPSRWAARPGPTASRSPRGWRSSTCRVRSTASPPPAGSDAPSTAGGWRATSLTDRALPRPYDRRVSEQAEVAEPDGAPRGVRPAARGVRAAPRLRARPHRPHRPGLPR